MDKRVGSRSVVNLAIGRLIGGLIRYITCELHTVLGGMSLTVLSKPFVCANPFVHRVRGRKEGIMTGVMAGEEACSRCLNIFMQGWLEHAKDFRR